VAVPQGALEVPAAAASAAVSLTAFDTAGFRAAPGCRDAYALDLRDDKGRALSSLPDKRAVGVLLRAASVPRA
jgi:hypothetical protein